MINKTFLFLISVFSVACFAMENASPQFKVIDGQLNVKHNALIFNQEFNFKQTKGLLKIIEAKNHSITDMAILLKTIKENKVVIKAIIGDKDDYVEKNTSDNNNQYLLRPYYPTIDGDNRLALHLINNGIYEILVPHDASIKVKGINSWINFATQCAKVNVDCNDFEYPEAGTWREGSYFGGTTIGGHRHVTTDFHVALQPKYLRLSSFMVMRDPEDKTPIENRYEPNVFLKTQQKIVVKYQHD